MKFENAIKELDTILENGPLGTRLKYDYGFNVTFNLIDQDAGRKALSELYEGDLAIAQENNLPIILNAATYRASRNHLFTAGCTSPDEIARINIACINLIKQIRIRNAETNIPIFIAAPLGSMGDAYNADSIPSIEESKAYHSEQIQIFRELDIDFVNVVTIPSLPEAIGIALAAEAANINYTIGFILRDDAKLLDGTSLDQAIEIIDNATIQKPLGYLVTCTHSSTISKISNRTNRIIGAQPNGSSLSINQLSKSEAAVSDSPEKFTLDLIALKKGLRLKIMGGCCGTTRTHLLCIAQNLNPSPTVNRLKR